jgi:hypothetical protein
VFFGDHRGASSEAYIIYLRLYLHSASIVLDLDPKASSAHQDQHNSQS